ncbi:RNA-directed DNA polymerase, eukaryota [Tanacetum coccineum]
MLWIEMGVVSFLAQNCLSGFRKGGKCNYGVVEVANYAVAVTRLDFFVQSGDYVVVMYRVFDVIRSSANNTTKVTVVVPSVRDGHVLSSSGGYMVEKVTESENNKGTSYAKLFTRQPSRNSVNFRALITPAGNGADVVVPLESIHSTRERSSYARAMIELRTNVELKDTIVVVMPKLVEDGFYLCTIHVEYEWKPPKCSSCKIFGHVLDECLKNFSSDVAKNLKNPKQAVRGTNGGNSKSVAKGSVNVTHGSSSNTLIIDKINKLECQILDGKLMFMDNEWNPLVPTGNVNKESEVEVVFDETANLMPSTSIKSGSDKETRFEKCFSVMVLARVLRSKSTSYESTRGRGGANCLSRLGTLGIKNTVTPTPIAYHARPTLYTGPNHANQGLTYATSLGLRFGYPVVHHQPAYVLAQPMSQPVSTSESALARVLAVSQPIQTELSGQPTSLPYAFSTVTLQDLAFNAWNMDTGASSHLNNSVNSLSEVFNMRMYPSISVGDGHSIPVTNTGHSILPTLTKSLHLNNVLIDKDKFNPL